MKRLSQGLSPTGTVRLRNSQGGYLLITVVVTLFLLATVAVMLTHGSAISANTASTELEASRAEYVAQAGMQHALWRAGNNTCMGDVTIPVTALGADSYSATVTGAAAGTFYTLSVDQDAWIRNDDVTKNNGTTADQHIRFESGNTEHTMTRFDLSALPKDAGINSAIAWFYVSTGGASGGVHPEGPLTVHRVTADWTETGATWDNMGGNFESSSLAMIPAQAQDGVWVSFNLTGQVQAWVNGQQNYGILMGSTAEGVHGKYASREDGSNPPRLEVVVGSGTASPVAIQATGTLADGNTRTLTRPASPTLQPSGTYAFQPDATDGIDAYIWEAQKTTNKGTDDETWVSRTSNNASLSLLKFNMGAIPARSKIIGATLSLHNRSGNNSNVPVTAHRITNPWDEDFVTWNNRESGTPWDKAGGDIDSNAIASTNVGPTRYIRYEWDITRLVQGWTDGAYPNYGVALATAMASSVGERFDTSDHADPTRRPRLTVSFACECGSACMAPHGSGKVLMPVTSTSNPTPGELFRIALLESWGYVVDTTWEKNSQSNFNSAIAANDVVYVPATVDPANVGSKLTDAPIGIVSEHVGLNSEFGIATGGASPVGNALDIVDTSHYITQVFSAGSLSFKTVDTALASTSGTKSLDAKVLATAKGQDALVALESGGVSTKGGTVTARRVLLPVGDSDVSSEYLTNNGQLVVQRSLAWAMNAAGTSSGPTVLFVVGNAGSPSARDADKKALMESWGHSVTLLDGNADEEKFKAAIQDIDVIYVSGSVSISAILLSIDQLSIPLVNEEMDLKADYGFSENEGYNATYNALTTDNPHYITEPFAGGDVVPFTSNILMWTLDGTMSDDLVHAGQIVSAVTVLATLADGDRRWDGTAVPGRRVQVPFENADVGQMTADGKTLMKRSIEWAAGAGCGSLNSLLLVVGNATTPSAFETARKTMIESWCYTVTIFDDSDSQSNFNTAAAAHDVVYVSSTISGGALADKLTGSPTPIVNEFYGKLDNFGFSSSTGTTISSDIFTATDAGHYITEPNAGAAVTAFGSALSMPVPGGTLAPDLQNVAEVSGTVALAALEAGGTRYDGNPAPARRVHLPLGNADETQITDDGKTLMRRAIDWATGAGGSGGLSGTFLDEFNAIAYNGSDGTLDWSIDWQESGESSGPGSGGISVVSNSWCASGSCLQIREDFTSIRRLSREADLTGAVSANLSLNYRRRHVSSPIGGTITLEISDDGGANFTPLKTYQMGTQDSSQQSDSFDISSYISPSAQIRFSASNVLYETALYVDNVLIDTTDGGGDDGGGGGGGISYVEKHVLFTVANADTWQPVNLSVPGVPANAVAEIAITNSRTGNERWGGVRARGSNLDRRFQLHEAEGGGVDTVVMHVQADENSLIEAYSDVTNEVTFRLLGYWTGATYVELFDSFTAGGSNSWREHNFNNEGVGPNQVAEVVIVNKSTSRERLAGVRPSGSGMQRRFNIHEAESGGVDTVSLMAGTDASAIAEVYTSSNADVDFYVVGYWSTPPGTYTEMGGTHGQMTQSSNWQQWDLASFGIPADSVVQVVMTNEGDTAEQEMGVRIVGSSLDRVLDLQEAEAGGSDNGSMHVIVNGSGNVEAYSESGANDRYFYPVGWWLTN